MIPIASAEELAKRLRLVATAKLELQTRVLEARERWLKGARAHLAVNASENDDSFLLVAQTLEDCAGDIWEAIYAHPSLEPATPGPASQASVGPESGSARPCSPVREAPCGGPVSEASEGGQFADTGGMDPEYGYPDLLTERHPTTKPSLPPDDHQTAGFYWLLCMVGISPPELLRRVGDRLGRHDLWSRVVAGDLLNDDQAITVTVVLAQELMVSIGHLRPVDVRLSYLLELRDLTPKGKPDNEQH